LHCLSTRQRAREGCCLQVEQAPPSMGWLLPMEVRGVARAPNKALPRLPQLATAPHRRVQNVCQ